jgi:hypothetical protein
MMPRMGYYYEQPPPDEERPPGCLDAIAITRAVFAGVLWPLLALMGAVIGMAITLWLFLLHPALALIPLGVGAAALIAFARWERGRDRPPDA